MALSEAQVARLRFRRELATARGPIRKPRTAAVIRFPTSARTRYSVALGAVLRDIQTALRELLLPRLPRVLEDAKAQQRLDAAADDAVSLMRSVRDRVSSEVPDERLARMAHDVARETSRQGKASLQTFFVQALGFNPIPIEEDLGAQLDAFAKQNVRLIRSVSNELLDQVEGAVLSGIREGQRVETVSKEIARRIGVSRGRAELIAVDQVAKLNGELSRLRQTKLGVKRYRWSTSQDERVRPRHKELNKTVQRWGQPPIVNARTGARAHPGGDVRCRCAAIPMLDEVFQALGIEQPRDPKKRVPKVSTKQKTILPVGATPVQRLRNALATHWGERRKDGGAAVRSAAREFLAAEFPMHRIDRVAQSVLTQRNRRGVRGEWLPSDGTILLHREVIDEIDAATEALSKGELPSLEHAPGLRTLLHEETHGHGAADLSKTYRFAGRYVEEVSTEVVARQAVRKLMDMSDRPQGAHPFALPKLDGGKWKSSGNRSYDDWIANMAADIQTATNWEESRVLDALEAAALAYKRRSEPISTVPEVARAWSESVVGLDDQQKADLEKLVIGRGYSL